LSTLKEDLKFWGFYQNNRYCDEPTDDGRSARDDHPIARATQFAPGTRAKADRKLIGRDGGDRRRMMGASAGLRDQRGRLLAVPLWMVDPIPCKETNIPAPRSPTAAVDRGSPDRLRWIDQALSELSRQNKVRALCVREEFTGNGNNQHSKAESVARQYGGALTVWQYRKELQRGMSYLEAKRR